MPAGVPVMKEAGSVAATFNALSPDRGPRAASMSRPRANPDFFLWKEGAPGHGNPIISLTRHLLNILSYGFYLMAMTEYALTKQENDMQRTLVIIKPDAVSKGFAGRIIAHFEDEGLKVAAMKMVFMCKEEAEGFYHVHRARPFFDSLTDFMSSGPCVPMVLEGNDAIDRVRTRMGATDPKNAARNTLRALYAGDVERNAVHGSDSEESASTEIPYFFNQFECFEYARGEAEKESEHWDPLPPLS